MPRTLSDGIMNLERTTDFLQEMQDVNAADNFQNSKLHLAMEKYRSDFQKHLQLIKFLIDNGADLNATNISGDTPFHWAARKNKWELVDYLIDHGADINIRNMTGNTALHLAVQNNSVETVAILHKYADAELREDIKNENNFSPRDIAETETEYPINEKIKEILRTDPEEYRKTYLDPERQLRYGIARKGSLPSEHMEPHSGKPGDAEKGPGISSKVPKMQPFSAWICNGDDTYEMTKKPRGICLIISNTDFQKSREYVDESGVFAHARKDRLENRNGADADVFLLEELFKSFHFVIDVHTDLDAWEMLQVLRECSRLDHSLYNCFVCCILSHGCSRGIYGVDGIPLNVVTITMLFNGSDCKSLAEKPKLFFFQACRGLEDDSGYVKDSATDERVSKDRGSSWEPTDIQSSEQRPYHMAWDEQHTHVKEKSPSDSDFFIAFPTPLGYVAWRVEYVGSWFIKKLSDVFHQYADREHLMELITRVNNEVSKLTAPKGHKQIPYISITLRKKLYFFPEEI